MTRVPRPAWLLPALVTFSCVDPPADVGEAAQDLASEVGKSEIAIDAPWRLEPREWTGGATAPQPGQECFTAPCTPTYPELPIQITIDDADRYEDDILGGNVPALAGTLGDFVSIQVTERMGLVERVGAPLPLTTLHEIEFQADAWPAPPERIPGTPSLPAPPFTPVHRVCRRWQGEACTPEFARVGDKNEWHATLMYRPQLQTRGGDLELDVTMRIARLDPLTHVPTGAFFTVVNHLRVHLAEAPLPRFDDRWAYGDLHYHAQGTDNDGESGYAYRGVLQAMAAMGLDFVLAADHASDSAQVTNIDVGDVSTWPPVSRHYGALRDMSYARFSHLHDWIYSEVGGANRQVLSFPWQRWGLRRIPQIVLGGEVDAIPEMDAAEQAAGTLRYGNDKVYPWAQACADVPDWLPYIYDAYACASVRRVVPPGNSPVLIPELVRPFLSEAREPNRFLIKDIQGWKVAFARQHLLSLPRRPGDDNFVTSESSDLGGATRRLGDILRNDYYYAQRGWVFLAHPNSAASGATVGRLGPDIVPYSESQLETAFAAEHVLGLQLWNEDDRGYTPVATTGAQDASWSDIAANGRYELDPRFSHRWSWMHRVSPDAQLHNGSATWDKMLLWGLDPRRTGALPWLPAGQPRRVLMAGGSDSHGDLNYRRYGEVDGTSGVGDSAIGKPRNLVFLGAPQGPDVATDGTQARSWSHEQIAGGLASGQFAVTDGPALRVALDTNHNGIIDDTDVPMGGVRQLARGEHAPVVVEWVSTPEFGRVTAVELYVGVHSDALGTGMVYAPFNHGVRGPNDPTGASTTVAGPGGQSFNRLNDHYWGDATGTLRRNNPVTEYGVVNRLTFDIDPAKFPVLGFDCRDLVTQTVLPDRFYVRAFVRTDGNPPQARSCDVLYPECVQRYAFSNPVWVTTPPPAPSGTIIFPPGITPTPAAFEPVGSSEAVRVVRRSGRVFDRGNGSTCASGAPPAPPNEWWRYVPAIDQKRLALGWPTASNRSGLLADNGGAAHFANNASIYFNPHVAPSALGSWGCAYSVRNGIRDVWWQSGSENGALGYPVTDERYWGGGAYQYFDKGALFWKSGVGTVTLRGEVAVRHLELMRQGFAAFPSSAAAVATFPAGEVAVFDNGSRIYWSAATGAHLVDGEFLTRYLAQGGPQSSLGYPTGDPEIGDGGVRFQRFVGGSMFAMPKTGFCQKYGPFSWFADLPGHPAP